MKQTLSSSQKSRMLLSRSKNRPYLAACPAAIVSAEFYLDLKLQKKVMKLCVSNRSGRALTDMTVLARYLDRDGTVMGDSAGFIVLRFSGIYAAAGVTAPLSKTVVLPYQDIAGIEAYITSITYDSGESEAFAAEDYVMTPRQEMLENHIDSAGMRLVAKKYGERCVFAAAPLPDNAWLCCCGAHVSGDSCPSCGLRRREALQLSHPAHAPARLNALRRRSLVLRILPYAAALALFVGGVLVLRAYYIRYTEEILPARRLAVTRQFIEEDRFTEAIGYSTTKNDSLLFEEILTEAVAHALDAGKYEEAIRYEMCRAEPDYEKIYRHAAEAYLDGARGEAERYALSCADETLYNSVLWRMANDAFFRGDYAGGCSLALSMRGAEGTMYADDMLYQTIALLLEKQKYEEAVAYIGHLHDTSGVAGICRGIEQELLTMGRYEEAFAVARITGDTSVFELAYPRATASTLRQYYNKFFPYMSDAERREYLATPIAADGEVVSILQNGQAYASASGYLAENAVSVAAGEEHILVLNENGVVYAYGGNSVGQCDCSGAEGVLAIAAGKHHSVLLFTDGTVRVYGDKSAGQGEVAAWKNVIAIAAGDRHTVALLASGKAVACGSDQSGQCSIGDSDDVVGVSAGPYATALLLRTGGIRVYGNIALDTMQCREWKDISAVAIGNAHLVALSGGKVYTAGRPEYPMPEEVADWSQILAIACSDQASYGIGLNRGLQYCGSGIPDLSAGEWGNLKK